MYVIFLPIWESSTRGTRPGFVVEALNNEIIHITDRKTNPKRKKGKWNYTHTNIYTLKSNIANLLHLTDWT